MALVSNRDIANGIVAGFKANGIGFTVQNVDVTNRGPNRLFMIRLSKDKKVLPSMGHIEAQIQLDRVPPGSVQGAHFCMIGMVQESGTSLRLTGRIIRVETGVVINAAKADGKADAKGMATAATSVVKELWKKFRSAA